MKTMKMLLIAGLIFVRLGSHELSAAEGVVIPQFSVKATKAKPNTKTQSSKSASMENLGENDTKNQDSPASVELIRMVSPDGNEVVFSLSKEIMGRSLKSSDFSISGIEQPGMALICQQAVTDALELRRAELKLELELMIEDLKDSPKPRSLSGTQKSVLENTPSCEMFRLSLTAISKLLDGYDYAGLETASVGKY